MWKEVDGTNGLYLVSDKGLIFSVRSNRVLKTQNCENGYCRIELNIDGKPQKEYIHRIVAKAFIPNPNNYPIINQKDENPANNCADNLEWCTYEYNSNYGTCQEKILSNREYKAGWNHVQSKPVRQFTLDGKLIHEYGSCGMAATITGLDVKSINKCANGKLKQYAGFGWSYTDTYTYDAHPHHTIRNGDIDCFDMNGKLVKTYHTQDELRADGFVPQSVCRVCRGERNQYHGYKFAYHK